jgi:hypothetical protein
VNRQSNLKLTRFKLIHETWPDMSSQTGSHAAKNRSGAKMMNLGPDKLTSCKLNTTELRENKGTTRSNINTRNHT